MRNDVFAVLPIRFWETTGNSDVFIWKEMAGGCLNLLLAEVVHVRDAPSRLWVLWI